MRKLDDLTEKKLGKSKAVYIDLLVAFKHCVNCIFFSKIVSRTGLQFPQQSEPQTTLPSALRSELFSSVDWRPKRL